MTKVKEKNPHSHIKTDINSNMNMDLQKAFEVIDNYLPKHYVRKVKNIVPEFSPENIRQVRNGNNNNTTIIKALVQVAIDNKKQLQLS